MKRITIKDIAKALNIHHSTVSRSLRNDSSVNNETRKRVLEYARNNGYQINRNALHLRGDKSNLIGVIVPNINHTFFSNIISVITDLAFENGFVVAVYQSNESLQHEQQIVKALIQNNVAGVLASVSMQTHNADHFKKLSEFHIPLVMFDRVTSDLNVSKILSKNEEALHNAVEFLANKGFKTIAHLSGPTDVNVFRERQNGYHMAIQKLALNYEQCIPVENGFTIENGITETNRLFQNSVVPDAIICDSHFLLLGVLCVLKNHRINVVSDFGLAGFGVSDETRILNPGIISIVQQEEKIAQAAFEVLLTTIKNKEKANIEDIHFEVTVIENVEISTTIL